MTDAARGFALGAGPETSGPHSERKPPRGSGCFERQPIPPRIKIHRHRLPVADLTRKQFARQHRLDFALQDSLERPGAKRRLVANSNDMRLVRIGQMNLDVPLLHSLAQGGEWHIYHLPYV